MIAPIMKKQVLSLFILFFLITIGIAVWQYSPVTVSLKKSSFEHLPGWNKANFKQSFLTFQISCKTFLRQDPERAVGSRYIPMKAKDWQPVCKAATTIKTINNDSAQRFFRQWFEPVHFHEKKPVTGLFTGYYLPLLHGSLEKTDEYNIPVYGLPDNIITINLEDFNPDLPKKRIVGRIENNQLLPFHTREEINKGALKNKAPVLVWVNSHIDRLFLEIQGSGMVELANGQQMFLGYAGENGAPYTPVGKVLVAKGIMTPKTASMQGIKIYLEAHPEEILPVINQNKSFVFFRELKDTAAMGAQGVVLTPGYSLAVDRQWIPLGTPLWLDTTHPVANTETPRTLQRLMVAQDTGGAIRGTVRGDVFWGAGDDATFTAGNMKNPGHYWLLLPRPVLDRLPDLATTK